MCPERRKAVVSKISLKASELQFHARKPQGNSMVTFKTKTFPAYCESDSSKELDEARWAWLQHWYIRPFSARPKLYTLVCHKNFDHCKWTEDKIWADVILNEVQVFPIWTDFKCLLKIIPIFQGCFQVMEVNRFILHWILVGYICSW